MTARNRTWLAVALWPVVITAAALLAASTMMGDLPETVVTHWGSGGRPDGFTPREQAPWFALYGLGAGWVIGAIVMAVSGRDGTQRRVAVGVAAGLCAFVSATMVTTLWIQRGHSDPTDVGGADAAVTVAVLVALAVAVAAARTVPGRSVDHAEAATPIPEEALRVDLSARPDPAWTSAALPSRWFLVLLAVVAATFLALAALADLWLFMLVTGGLVLGAALAMSVFRVRVDEAGLTVRGLIGLPTWRIPLGEVAVATVVTVSPVAEFGGWGYRFGAGGRTGFVVRAGQALEVTRGDGTRWVVTVDDAAEAAGLLNALAERTRA